jgi:hypothetical protein
MLFQGFEFAVIAFYPTSHITCTILNESYLEVER